jgi:hypothetical protein
LVYITGSVPVDPESGNCLALVWESGFYFEDCIVDVIKQVCQFRVEVFFSLGFDKGKCLIGRYRILVTPFRRHGIEYISQGCDPSPNGYLLTA